MDFSLTSDQEELRDLTRRILSDRVTLERLVEVEAGNGADLELWKELAEAGLAGINLPESVGGGGLGFFEAAIVLEQVGVYVAPVPALAVLAMAGPTLVETGALDALEGVASGDRIVTVALHEALGDVREPVAFVDEDGLHGVKVCVPFGTFADAFVVSATDGLYLVDARADGVEITAELATNRLPEALVEFSGAAARRLGGPDALERLIQRGQAGQAMMATGVCETALHMTAEYAKERVQFGRAIATFQAVSQRVADARIDTEAIRLTALQAAVLLANGDDAAEQVATAKFWVGEGGQRVVHAAAHIHGGVGVDRDYPLHRYFLWAKHLELFLGGATPSLRRLGQLLADTPVAPA
jgi:alkylation response protein AidB-like acyl-CoA dehydrogenase